MASNKRLLREWVQLDYKPQMIKESREKNGGKLMLQGIIQKAETKNQNKRIYPRQVLQREIENYTKAVRENRAVGELDHPECVTNGYYLLSSSRGWMPIEEVKEGDDILTLDTCSGKIVSQRVMKKIDQNYTGKMIRVWNSKGTLEQTLTPNHRMLLWDRSEKPYFITAQEFHELNSSCNSGLSHSYMKCTGDWIGEDSVDRKLLPGTDIEVDSCDWAAFLGIWLAEGWADGTRRGYKHSNAVCIAQKKEEVRAEIRTLLTSMEIPFIEDEVKFIVRLGPDFHEYFFDLGNSETKRIPVDVKNWSPKLLSILLEWMLKGDGRNRKGYKRKNDVEIPTIKEYATVSIRLANDVQEIMVKLGYGGTIHTYKPTDRESPDFQETGRMILGENSRPINIVYGHVSRTIPMDSRFVRSEVIDYSGRVYCVQVENGTWLARSPTGQTFWTGNSSSVSLSNVSHVIREMWWEGDNVCGRVEVLPTPKGKILESILESGVTIGISSRGVGSTEQTNEGFDMVQPDFQIICFDIVSEPSTPGAYLQTESKTYGSVSFAREDRIFRALNDIVLRGKR